MTRRRFPVPAHRAPRRSADFEQPRPDTAAVALTSRDRYLNLDRYRVEREWQRYQGTPQRDLFRQLRERFLRRHAVESGWALEVGPGPGRFSPLVGRRSARRVLLDLSIEMLGKVRETWPRGPDLPILPELVRGDGTHPPLRPESFDEVVALGNPLGFSGPAADQFLSAALGMLGPGGKLVLETVAGPGERSRYLARLPPKAVQRLLVAPVNAVRPRVEREGFAPLLSGNPARHGFRRFGLAELLPSLDRQGVEVEDVLAVAPMLGAEPERIAAVHSEPAAWAHLLELEEAVGRSPPRHRTAAALLVAGTRRPTGVARSA